MIFDRQYHREYETNRYQQRKTIALNMLGGCCSACGAVEDLQFDHIDPSTKLFNISEGGTRNEAAFWQEVDKCQLLCIPCHKEKTVRDGFNWMLGTLNPNNKLRELDVKYLRELYRLGHSQRRLAQEFGVSRFTVNSIVQGHTWAWLDPESLPVVFNPLNCPTKLLNCPTNIRCTGCKKEKNPAEFGSDARKNNGKNRGASLA